MLLNVAPLLLNCHLLCKISTKRTNVIFVLIFVLYTGRQLRTLFSVLYRIISKRRYILAAQLLLREKSGT